MQKLHNKVCRLVVGAQSLIKSSAMTIIFQCPQILTQQRISQQVTMLLCMWHILSSSLGKEEEIYHNSCVLWINQREEEQNSRTDVSILIINRRTKLAFWCHACLPNDILWFVIIPRHKTYSRRWGGGGVQARSEWYPKDITIINSTM